MLADKLDIFSQLSLPLFAFYMLMFGNFTNRLLGDKMYSFIKNNTIIKHCIAYFNLLFFIILANEKKLEDGVEQLFIYTTTIYIFVILTLSLNPFLIALIILMLLIIYILDIFVKIKTTKNKNIDISNYIFIRNFLAFLTICIIIIGYLVTIYKKWY